MLLALWTCFTLLAPVRAVAWSPQSQATLGLGAMSIAPRDFSRLLMRHKSDFRRGLLAPFDQRDSRLHQQNGDGSGALQEVIRREVQRAINAIEGHRTFSEIAYQAGIAVHYMNDANNPLNSSTKDPLEGKFFGDFVDYLQSIEPRIQLAFTGRDEVFDEDGDVGAFVARALERSRTVYPMIGKEYRRIGKLPGRRYFDDRSTAFGVAAISHSRALTDAALLLRYIWIQAGGADWRALPTKAENRLFVLAKPEDTGGSKR